ncbi:hypothetical protein K438DRAFT_1781119 [Mycena galopus ATCC 62051]|nr:hypothetical protein K438DRAFT_1781119 [Mycena galopus ATCC 62051]
MVEFQTASRDLEPRVIATIRLSSPFIRYEGRLTLAVLSDVFADLRVNVRLEGSEKVLWFNERFLEDEEIIEHLVHSETRRTQWTMHRPRNGWYICIRSPAFPPGAFIPFIPPRLNARRAAV